ncbi:MAG TPA: cupin-like domain-containing protein [Polyangiaceae bacterium]|nr:cupin-like domain-containing protein [Polyangiaceae bacterium]
MYSSPNIRFDTAAFDPMRIQAVRHELMGHPLLELPELVQLAARLEPRGLVRRHSGAAKPSTDFHSAPETLPTQLPALETIKNIEQADAWMALHNIQEDPKYRTLVDEVLDFVRPMIEPKDPGMCHRAGWIFVTSPGAVTPFHMDHEHNFILHVHGKKTLHVFDPLDRNIVSERALELFHTQHSRELIKYDESFERGAQVFELEPGMGGYMPTTAPHWVKNGDGVSVTISCTYYTQETLRRKLLHKGNYFLRRVGLQPKPVGESELRDTAKSAAFKAHLAAKGVLRSLRGTPQPPLTGRYAVL